MDKNSVRKIVATFGGRSYDATIKLTVERAKDYGADEVLVFDDKWLINHPFHSVNRWIFEAKSRIQDEPTVYQHGMGWCSWKSAIINYSFDRCADTDVVLYLDADTFPVAPFGQLFDRCAEEGGVLIFAEQASNLRFTRADCMVVMGLPVADGPHACGRFSLWQKGSFLARQMLAEWWAYSINPHCTLWGRSTIVKDPPEYYRNSTEQSVLSNLGIKYKLPFHRTPDQFGAEQPGDEWYPQLFEQQWCTGDRSDLSGSAYRNV